MDSFEIEIGKRIRNLREKLGYSREQLSEMSNIGSKFLYEIENGKKGMSAYTLYNISSALNVTCDYILTGNTNETNLTHIENTLLTLNQNEVNHIEQIINHLVKLIKEK